MLTVVAMRFSETNSLRASGARPGGDAGSHRFSVGCICLEVDMVLDRDAAICWLEAEVVIRLSTLVIGACNRPNQTEWHSL